MAIGIHIDGVPQAGITHRFSPLTPQWRLGGRSTLDFTIRDEDQLYYPIVGHSVTLFDGLTPIWGGSIDEFTDANQDWFHEFQLRCVSHERMLDKRTWGPTTYGKNFFTADSGTDIITAVGHSFPNGRPVQVRMLRDSDGNTVSTLPGGLAEDTTYWVINQSTDVLQLSATSGGGPMDITSNGSGLNSIHWTAGAILMGVLGFYASEGITTGSIQPGARIDLATYDRTFVWPLISELAELSGYVTYINPSKALYFIPRNTTAAPWDITNGSKVLQSEGFSVRHTREQLANRIYVRIAKESRAATLQQREGDGSKRWFRLGTAIRELVSLTTSASSEPTVGVLGADAFGTKDWYYTPNDYWLVQDPGGTALTAGQFVFVTYYAPGFDTETAEDAAAQAVRAGIEGGTGIYERVEDRIDLTTREAGQAYAEAALAQYKELPKEVTFTTREPGLLPGMVQTINLGAYGINASFLIQSVTSSFDDDGNLRYTATAISTTKLNDFLTTFQSFLSGGSTGGGASVVGGGGAGGGGGGVTILPVTLTEGAGTDTIAQPVVSGGILVLHFTQNTTGDRAIAWSGDFDPDTTVDIPRQASTSFTMTFGAIDSLWRLLSGPTLVKHQA